MRPATNSPRPTSDSITLFRKLADPNQTKCTERSSGKFTITFQPAEKAKWNIPNNERKCVIRRPVRSQRNTCILSTVRWSTDLSEKRPKWMKPSDPTKSSRSGRKTPTENPTNIQRFARKIVPERRQREKCSSDCFGVHS